MYIKEEDKKRLMSYLGEEILAALNNKNVVEIFCNPDGNIYIEQHGKGSSKIGNLSESTRDIIISYITDLNGITINENNPCSSTLFPLGKNYRFSSISSPIVDASCFCIRKASNFVYKLEDYIKKGELTTEQCSAIRQAIASKQNIIVAGATGSGKTTFANTLIAEFVSLFPKDRIVTIEDTPELYCPAKNYIRLLTSDTHSLADLIKQCLRMAPARIFIGEVRDHTALDVLDAWNTGHDGGILTIHASSAKDTLLRLNSLVNRHPRAPKDTNTLISSVINLIIFMAKTTNGRKVRELVQISPVQEADKLFNYNFI